MGWARLGKSPSTPIPRRGDIPVPVVLNAIQNLKNLMEALGFAPQFGVGGGGAFMVLCSSSRDGGSRLKPVICSAGFQM